MHSVRYEQPGPRDIEPGFEFEKFVFPDHPESIDKVRGGTSSEARHLWKCCKEFGKNFRGAVDVGASVGAMTHTLASLYDKVWAFEPWPETFALLETNSVFFPACDVTLSNEALGREYKTGVMYSAHLSRRDAHLEEAPKGQRGDNTAVRCVPLDMAIPSAEPIDLIKIDVEGTEVDVLLGAKGIIKRCRPLIYIEIKSTAREETGAWMRNNNYERLAQSGHNFLYGAR